jgi:predicted secreted protein
MRGVRWFPVGLALLLLAGCGQAHRRTHESILHLTAQDNLKQFTVKPQTAIVVTLPWNSSTGYHWKYKQSMGSGNVVYLTSAFEYPAKKGSPPGAAGKKVWHFRAADTGSMGMLFLDTPPGSSRRSGQTVTIAIRVR